MSYSLFKNIDDSLFQTGTVTSDALGRATVQLKCFRPEETPCVTVSSIGLNGNLNANCTNLVLIGNVWQIDIITSVPSSTVFYHAVKVKSSSQ